MRQQESKQCSFSIIIPVLNESERINSVIEYIQSDNLEDSYDIIVVDGDPHGSTIGVVHDKDVRGIVSAKGRGRQMNAGVDLAQGEILMFLHADTKLPKGALEKVGRLMHNKDLIAGAFDLALDSNRKFLKFIEVVACIRSRLNRIPYGDQAIFVRKEYFDQIGGFREIPLFEDIDLMRRIKKDRKKICILPDKVITSARRWEAEGAFYTTIRNWILVSLYYLGISSYKLAKVYGPAKKKNDRLQCKGAKENA